MSKKLSIFLLLYLSINILISYLYLYFFFNKKRFEIYPFLLILSAKI